MISFLR